MSLAQKNSRPLDADPSDDALATTANPACWAAVSFAFEDAVWCDWIYREFDGTRVPKPLTGRPSRHGTPYPERISVSPDPADPQQLENYAETLKVAQHLIIIVSPGSANYHAMQEHIRIFRASGGEERIIALVVKGEPASPSAEAGSSQDLQWLPKWLQWRFQNNQFDPGPPCEPYVVDARLGASSLAEVRARLCAALLEVPVTQLGELGVVSRSSTADLAMHTSPVIVSMPEPTPLPTLSEIAVPAEEPAPRTSKWPVFVCAAAAATALGFLALWPTRNLEGSKDGSNGPSIKLKPQKPAETQSTTQVSTVKPLVAVVAVQENKPELQVTKTAPAPERPPQPAAVVNETPNATPPAHVNTPANTPIVSEDPGIPSPSGTSGLTQPKGPAPKVETMAMDTPPALTPEAEAAERKRYELASRRDRLVRLAESKVNTGETDEAIATFQQAVDTAHELVNRTDGGHDEVIELALLYRRFGNFAAGVNSSAEGRMYFERGRKALQALRVRGKLPREAFKILGDLEAAAKSGARE